MDWEKFDRKIKRLKAVADWSENTALSRKGYVGKKSYDFKKTINKQLEEARLHAERRDKC